MHRMQTISLDVPFWVILRLYWGYMGIMEKKIETTITGYIGFRTYEGLGFSFARSFPSAQRVLGFGCRV